MARLLFPLVTVALASEDAAFADFDDALSLLQLASKRVDVLDHFDDTRAVKVTTTVDAPAQIATDKRCAGSDLVRGKFDTAEACLAEFVPRGDVTTVAYYTQGCRNPRNRGICLGWGGECRQTSVHSSVNTALYDLFPPVIEDEASATGDPHLVTASGDKIDLCCHGGKCEPCPALLDLTTTEDAPAQIGTDKRCKGRDLVRGKFDTAEACLAEYALRGDVTTVAYYTQGCRNPKNRGMCLGWGGECKQSGVHSSVNTALYDLSPPVVEAEASATGDPHLVTASGATADLCCKSGKCEPCPALLDLTTTVDAPAQIATDKRCAGSDLVRGKFDSVEACLAEYVPRGDVTTIAYYTQGCRNPRNRGICLGWSGECRQSGVHATVNTVLYDLFPPVIEDEASATGDPHLVTASGEKIDLCCQGGKCEPCSN